MKNRVHTETRPDTWLPLSRHSRAGGQRRRKKAKCDGPNDRQMGRAGSRAASTRLESRKLLIFLVGHVTLHLVMSVDRSVRPSVRNMFEFRAVFALLLLPNRPQLDCRVSGLV